MYNKHDKIEKYYYGNIVIIGQHTGNMGDEIAGFSLAKRLIENINVNKINIIYRGYDDRSLEIVDPKVVHQTSLPLTKCDVINLIFSCFILKKKKPINCLASDYLKKIDDIFEMADVIFVSPSGAAIGIYQDERLLSMLLLAIAKRKSPVFHYCTIGKSKSLIFNWIGKYALKRSTLFLREEKSIQFAKTIGIENADFGYDTAFSFKRFRDVDEDIKKLVENKPIVMIINELNKWHPDFVGNNDDIRAIQGKVIPAVVNLAKCENRRIVLLPHILETNEFSFLKQMINMTNEDSRTLFDIANITSVNDYDYVIENACIVVTMRYHGVVMAAKNEVPFVAISYENKMREVSKYVNCLDSCISFKDIIEGKVDISSFIEQIWNKRCTIVEKLKEFKNI